MLWSLSKRSERAGGAVIGDGERGGEGGGVGGGFEVLRVLQKGGHEGAAEGVAGAGRVDHRGGNGGAMEGAGAAGVEDQAAFGAELYRYDARAEGGKLTGGLVPVAVAGEAAHLLGAREEDVDAGDERREPGFVAGDVILLRLIAWLRTNARGVIALDPPSAA